VEALLKVAGWKPIPSSETVQGTVAKQVALYKQIIHTEAWKDYQYRLSQLREATRSQIERGGLDKFGHRHDDEQRSVLYLLDQLISYLPEMQERHDQIQAHLVSQEALAGEPLYGKDHVAYLTSDF
jgi:hypothetical protein